MKYSVVLGASASVAEQGTQAAAATARAATALSVDNLESVCMMTLRWRR
jgi:hypothetical protein